jgi:hypothetical protein
MFFTATLIAFFAFVVQEDQEIDQAKEAWVYPHR